MERPGNLRRRRGHCPDPLELEAALEQAEALELEAEAEQAAEDSEAPQYPGTVRGVSWS